jgi:CRP-like cAMP-binding protein
MWALTPRELQRVQEHSLVLIKSAEQQVAGFLLEMARRWVRASSTNAILIQVNVAIGRSAEMAAPEEDVFLGGLYQRGSVAKCDGNSRYESR